MLAPAPDPETRAQVAEEEKRDFELTTTYKGRPVRVEHNGVAVNGTVQVVKYDMVYILWSDGSQSSLKEAIAAALKAAKAREQAQTVEAPPPFDPSRDGSLGVERCRAALVEILGRNVTEEAITNKMEDDERDPSQISFGDFRWLLSECENDFDMADEAEEEAKRLRDEEAEQRRQEYEDEVQERSKERGPQARGLLPMGAFWDTEDGKELMATLPPYEGRKKTREDMRKASTDPTPISKLAQQLEAEMYARLEAQKNAPAPAPEIPDSPLPAGSALQVVKKRTKRRDPPPLTVQPQVCEIPSAALGCVYDIPLSITVRPGGKVRLDVSSKNLRVVERPRHSIAPGETENAIIEYTAGSQGPIQEFVDVLAQFGTVRVPIVGWVDAPQGGPCSPSTVTES